MDERDTVPIRQPLLNANRVPKFDPIPAAKPRTPAQQAASRRFFRTTEKGRSHWTKLYKDKDKSSVRLTERDHAKLQIILQLDVQEPDTGVSVMYIRKLAETDYRVYTAEPGSKNCFWHMAHEAALLFSELHAEGYIEEVSVLVDAQERERELANFIEYFGEPLPGDVVDVSYTAAP